MNVRYLAFLISVYFGQGSDCEYFIYRLVPVLKTITTFCSLVGIQRNQRSLLRYDPLYPDKQLKHVFDNLKIEFSPVYYSILFRL